MPASDSTLEVGPAASPLPVAKLPAAARAPRKRAASPPIQTKAPIAADDSPSKVELPASPWSPARLLSGIPSWLVSLTVHLLLIVLMALLTIAPQAASRPTILAASISTDEAPLVEILEFVPQKLDAPEAITTAVASADLTMNNVGDLREAIPAATIAASDLDAPAGAEIGEIFSGGGGMQSSALAGGQGAQFFGVKATGRRFVFVVDSSNSMKNGKFDAAKEELAYAIHRLSKDQFFYVIFFDHDAARMTFAPSTEPEEFTVPATNANIGKFEKWMVTVENELRTDPYEAMKFAMEMSPDAIYILSDGKFTDRGQTVRYLAERNVIDDPVTGRIPRVAIHTIAFWQNDGEEQMKSIAKDYGGTYRFVPPPKGAKVKKKNK